MSELNRILFVEDEPDIQAVASIALRDVGGFTIEVCSSGQEALQKAADFCPDLLLLDVMMPDMDGPSTLEALRQLDVTRDTPAIFMTAKVQTHEVEHFKSIGAVDVVAKPFDPMTLAQTLREIWQAQGL